VSRLRVAPGATRERWLALVILACGLFCCGGCTLLGPFVGGAVPRFERAVPPEEIAAHKEKGEPLDVVVVRSRRPGAAPDEEPGRVVGSYVRLTAKELLLMTDEGLRAVPRLDVQRVDVRTGSYWAAGLGLGLLADVLTVGLIVFLIGKGAQPS